MALLAGLGVVIGVGEALVVLLVISIASGDAASDLPLTFAARESTILMALGCLLLLGSAHYAAARAAAKFAADAERTVQGDLVRAFLAAPWPAQVAMHPGELQDLVSNKAAVLGHGTQQAASAAATAVNLLVVVVAAVTVNVLAASLLGLALLVVLGIALTLRATTRRAIFGTVAADTAVATHVAEAAVAAREFRVFGVIEAARQRLDEKIEHNARLAERARRIALAVPPVTRDVAVAVLVLALAVIVELADVSLAALGATAVLSLRGLAHAQALAGFAQSVVERRASLDLIRTKLSGWQPLASLGTRPCPALEQVEVCDVSHTYATAARAVSDVTITLRRGEILGVVGPTGSGKTTLAAVILGLIRPTDGQVRVDGRDLAEIDPREWHQRTAWVGQDPQLLSGTIADNVRFLRTEVSDRAIQEAVEAAALAPDLALWPDGLDHDVGPAGGYLSGGQRQRVALARAIAADPSLVVLDEPTSALDAHSESAINRALLDLRKKSVVVVIAHRLTTVRSCDRVAVLEGGRITALAPPAELERSSAWFREALELSRDTSGSLPS